MPDNERPNKKPVKRALRRKRDDRRDEESEIDPPQLVDLPPLGSLPDRTPQQSVLGWADMPVASVGGAYPDYPDHFDPRLPNETKDQAELRLREAARDVGDHRDAEPVDTGLDGADFWDTWADHPASSEPPPVSKLEPPDLVDPESLVPPGGPGTVRLTPTTTTPTPWVDIRRESSSVTPFGLPLSAYVTGVIAAILVGLAIFIAATWGEDAGVQVTDTAEVPEQDNAPPASDDAPPEPQAQQQVAASQPAGQPAVPATPVPATPVPATPEPPTPAPSPEPPTPAPSPVAALPLGATRNLAFVNTIVEYVSCSPEFVAGNPPLGTELPGNEDFTAKIESAGSGTLSAPSGFTGPLDVTTRTAEVTRTDTSGQTRRMLLYFNPGFDGAVGESFLHVPGGGENCVVKFGVVATSTNGPLVTGN